MEQEGWGLKCYQMVNNKADFLLSNEPRYLNYFYTFSHSLDADTTLAKLLVYI